MHSTSSSGYGYSLPSKIWYGENSCVCLSYASAIRACGKPSSCIGYVSHKGTCFSNKQGVREVFEIYATNKGA